MTIWPVFLDSQPEYLVGRDSSLLLAPLGARTVVEHLQRCLVPVTRHAPLVFAADARSGEEHERAIRALCPASQVIRTATQLMDALSVLDVCDAILIIDPRCLPFRESDFVTLVEEHRAEPRVAHHLVAFEKGIAGTKERVTFDSAGQVRRIL